MTTFGHQDILALVIHVPDINIDVLNSNSIPCFFSRHHKLINACWSMGSGPKSLPKGMPDRLNGIEVRERGRMRENVNAVVRKPVLSWLRDVTLSTVVLEYYHTLLFSLLQIEYSALSKIWS